ncbi:MAG: hypothetical protein R3A12_17995 [Ignavibacteria bacterium]
MAGNGIYGSAAWDFPGDAAEQGMFTGFGFNEAAGMDPELGLPLLLRQRLLPIGLMGVMMSAYFSTNSVYCRQLSHGCIRQYAHGYSY